MKRPLSPRRDFLMRCAEQQLMPVPVINRALKLDQSTARKDTATGGAKRGPEANVEQNGADQVGGEGKGIPVPLWSQSQVNGRSVPFPFSLRRGF